MTDKHINKPPPPKKKQKKKLDFPGKIGVCVFIGSVTPGGNSSSAEYCLSEGRWSLPGQGRASLQSQKSILKLPLYLGMAKSKGHRTHNFVLVCR